MATANEKLVDQVMRQGNVIYGYDYDGKHSYPLRTDASGILGQRISMVFYPGSTVLTNGAVATGTRSGAQTITTLATADVTVWGPESIFASKEIGKIDGVSTGGILSGQITIGIKSAAGTVNAKVSARIRNNPTGSAADTSAWDVLVAQSSATATTTAETFVIYDIPHLKSNTAINSVPMGISLGMQTAVAASATIGRIMENSYFTFDIVPGT